MRALTKMWTAALMTALAWQLAAALPATAVDADVKCEAGKLKEAAKYISCRLKADSKALTTAVSPDYSKCDGKFTTKFPLLEEKAGLGVCPTEGDLPTEQVALTADAVATAWRLAADFRDRIVHHVLVDRQEAIFGCRFSRESFACRKGKGTLAASDRLMVHLRAAWALKLDVASFFPSIDKRILYERIASTMRDPELLWLTRTILFHDPTLDYRFRCLDRHVPPPESPGYPVPERKSLFGKDGQRGLPIGNLTSQFWANVDLDVLDQFVKRTLRCPWYVCYVDDMVLRSTVCSDCAALPSPVATTR